MSISLSVIYSGIANSNDPDQTVSSGSTRFVKVIPYEIFRYIMVIAQPVITVIKHLTQVNVQAVICRKSESLDWL